MSVKLFSHDAGAELERTGGVFVKQTAERGLLVDQVVLDVEPVNTVFETLQTSNVRNVVRLNNVPPFAQDILLFGLEVNLFCGWHGVLPLVGRFIIQPAPPKVRHKHSA